MLMLVVWGLNVALGLFALGVAALSGYMGVEFCLGALFATAIYNVCHRILYGRWL